MLDEATSALDNITQAKIQRAISNIRGERTVITIAHRLSPGVHADRIMVIGRDGALRLFRFGAGEYRALPPREGRR